jgi:hemerythrin superfamily protein
MPNRFDSMVSHGRGVMKQFRARLEGVVGVFATLTKQHGELTALLERCQHHRDRRGDLWPEIRRQLLVHERAEARVLYPELRLRDATRTLADHHDAELRDLEQLVDRLDAEAIASDAWGEVLDRLTETVSRHAVEEERQIFPAAQKALGPVRARSLDAALLAIERAGSSTV